MDRFVFAGDVAQVHVDAGQQFAQATQHRSELEEKLAQVERNALLTLNNIKQSHREQLEADHQQKVRCALSLLCACNVL